VIARSSLFLYLVLLAAPRGAAQDSSEVTDGFRRVDGGSTKKTVATALVATIVAGTLADSYFTWWARAEKPFSFLGHGGENWLNGAHLGIDKPGHMFGAYCMFKIIHNTLLWGGYDRSTAFWWAAGIGIWNGLQIEIGDGFTMYGFDYQDLVFDVAGVGYGMLQSQVPVLQNFNLKFSYWSQKGITSPANFTTDYDALTIWLTINVHNLLPTSMDKYWPKFLQLAVGYGVTDQSTRRELAIGLDLSIESLFNPSNEDRLWMTRIADMLHLPAPAVIFTEGKSPRFDLFYLK
jgi:hypothetical protein